MADNLKVFKDGIIDGSSIQNNNEIVLIDNDSTTQAVVKDVVVKSSVTPTLASGDPATVELYAGETKLGDYKSLTGSAIIDTNEKLYYKLTPTPVVSGNYEFRSTGNKVRAWINGTSNIALNAVSPSLTKPNLNYDHTFSDADIIRNRFDATFTDLTSTGSDSLSVPSMNNPVFYYASPDLSRVWYFYYDGNSTTYLYSAPSSDNSGVPTSSWRSEPNSSYAYAAFDLNNNKISMNGNNNTLYVFDATTTSLIVSQPISFNSASTYSSSAACNNKFFWHRSSGVSSIRYVDVNDVIAGSYVTRSISFPTNIPSGNYQKFAVTYNPSEDRYYFIIGYGSSNNEYFYFTINGSIINSNSNVTVNPVYSSDITEKLPNGWNSSNFIIGDSYGHIFVRNGQNTAWDKVKFSGGTGTSANTDGSGTVVTSYEDSSVSTISGWYEAENGTVDQTSPVTINDLKTSVKVRVSGIEITGV